MEKVLRQNCLFPWAKKKKELLHITRSITVKNGNLKDSIPSPNIMGMLLRKHNTLRSIQAINTFSSQAVLCKQFFSMEFQIRMLKD
jgi:hypothetical protein